MSEHQSCNDLEAFLAMVSLHISEGAEMSVDLIDKLDDLLTSREVEKLPFLDRQFLGGSIESRPQLVRHIGMVQDQLEPEYYINQIDGKSAHYRDLPPRQECSDDALSNLSERQPFFIVPIPFASKWLTQGFLAKTEEQLFKDENIDIETHTSIQDKKSRKRERDTSEENNSSKPRIEANQDSYSVQKLKNSFVSVDWWPAGCMGSDESLCPVIAKFYYEHSSNRRGKLRLNDLVETIGVVSINPWEADFSSAEAEIFLDVMPPPSQIVRLHVLAFQKIDLDNLAFEVVDKASSVDAKDIFASVLKKSIASQVFFLSLLSKAERKTVIDFEEPHEMVQRTSSSTIGCLSLQFLTTSSDTKSLYHQLKSVLQSICPVVATVDISSNQQNTTLPAKTNGHICPTPWQLPKGSTLLIHLGEVDPRKQTLEELSLEELVKLNRIPYSFEGGLKIPFDADYRIIVVANKNVNCSMTVKYESSDITTSWEGVQATLRNLLASCRRACNVKLSPQVLEKAQADFLSQRSTARTDRKLRMPQEEDFHRWLCITRLLSRQRQSNAASIEDWNQAFALDNAVSDSTM
jgi:hypothetical protein